MSFIEMEYYISETRVYPEGWQSIGITSDLTKNFAEIELTVDNLTFYGESKLVIESVQASAGIQAAIPMLIQIDTFQEEFVLSPKKNYEQATDYLTFGVKKRNGISRFMDRANGTGWDLVDRRNTITGATLIPYRVIDPNRAPLIISLLIQEAMLLISLYDKVRGFSYSVASIAGGATGFLESALMLIAELIHLGLMIATWLITTDKLFKQLYPPKKFCYENKLYNLIKQGVESLGFTLSSNLLQSYGNAAIVPSLIKEDNPSLLDDILGNVGYFNGKFPSAFDEEIDTVGKLIERTAEMLSARMMIVGNTLIFENDAYFQSQPTLSIETNLTDQENYTNRIGYNLGDGWQQKYLGHQIDITDRYTLDQIKGIRAEYITEYTGNADADLVEIQGNRRIETPFALAKRKDSLSAFDEIALNVAVIIDGVFNALGGNSDRVGQIQGSIGEMIISDPHFEKPKIVWTVGGKQPANYLDKIGARAIYEANHTHRQVKEDFKSIWESQLRFSVPNFIQILNQYYVNDQSNNKCELLSYEWITGDSLMTLNYGINEPEKSLTQTVIIHG